MTTNQTIDGVPRAALEILLSGKGGLAQAAAAHELRALLDGSVCKACNDTGKMHEPGQDPGSCTACLEKTAAQPQGEPVAHTMKSVMAAICSIDGFPILTSNQCHALAVKLNAEQPAPVAAAPAGFDRISMNGLVVNLDGYTLYAPGATPSMCDCNQGRLPCRCKP